jgi:hypothetical protein
MQGERIEQKTEKFQESKRRAENKKKRKENRDRIGLRHEKRGGRGGRTTTRIKNVGGKERCVYPRSKRTRADEQVERK